MSTATCACSRSCSRTLADKDNQDSSISGSRTQQFLVSRAARRGHGHSEEKNPEHYGDKLVLLRSEKRQNTHRTEQESAADKSNGKSG